jgi:hypothetical protein
VIPAGVWCVGVFVNAEKAQIASLVERLTAIGADIRYLEEF